MKLTKRGEYALRALVDMGIAKRAGRQWVRLIEISERESIPLPFLEQIVMDLRLAGFVQGRRGPRGGCALACPPEQITLAQVVRTIDGPLAPLKCASSVKSGKCTCPNDEMCEIRPVMREVRDAIANILEKRSIADIIDKTARNYAEKGQELPFTLKEDDKPADYQI